MHKEPVRLGFSSETSSFTELDLTVLFLGPPEISNVTMNLKE